MAENPVKRLTITIEGRDDGDMEYALDEILKLVQDGNTSGFNSNDTGAFRFVTDTPNEKSLRW